MVGPPAAPGGVLSLGPCAGEPRAASRARRAGGAGDLPPRPFGAQPRRGRGGPEADRISVEAEGLRWLAGREAAAAVGWARLEPVRIRRARDGRAAEVRLAVVGGRRLGRADLIDFDRFVADLEWMRTGTS